MEEELDPKITDLLSKFDSIEENTLADDEDTEDETITGSSSLTFGNLSTGGFSFSNVWSSTFLNTSQVTTHYLGATVQDGELVVDLTKHDEPVILRTKTGDINLNKLQAMMERLDEILCVVEKMNSEDENFPSLATAYRHFRVVEAIARSTPKDDGE